MEIAVSVCRHELFALTKRKAHLGFFAGLELLALIAPRPLYIESCSEDLWADPYGEYLSLVEASKVYALYGLEGFTSIRMPEVEKPDVHGLLGHHIRAGKHDITLYDWERYIVFADKYLK